MKRYQINQIEYDYIKDMLTYLDTTENQMSNEGRKDMKDVLGRIKSRPVLDIIIGKELNVHTDPTEEQQNKSDNIMTEVTNTEATVEDYLAFIKAEDEAGSVAYLESFFDKSEEGQSNMRKFVDQVMETAANEVVESTAMAPAEVPAEAE